MNKNSTLPEDPHGTLEGREIECQNFTQKFKQYKEGSVIEKEWQTIGGDQIPEHEIKQDGMRIPIQQRFPNGEQFPGENLKSRSTLVYHFIEYSDDNKNIEPLKSEIGKAGKIISGIIVAIIIGVPIMIMIWFFSLFS